MSTLRDFHNSYAPDREAPTSTLTTSALLCLSPVARHKDTMWFSYAYFRLNYPIGCEHLHVTQRVTAAIHGCAVRMGDASRERYKEMLWETSSDLGGDNCSCSSVSVCILFHLLVSLMHQVYIKIFCIRHQLLPEFSFHQLPEIFHNKILYCSKSKCSQWKAPMT